LGSPAAAGLELDRVGLTTRATDALLAAGHPYRALALVGDQLAAVQGRVGEQDRARLLIALAQAATVVDLPADSTVSSLAATTEALGLVPPDAGALRAQLLAVHARANADHGHHEEALRWAVEAQQLAERLGLTRVAADAATTAARLEERTGNPDESQRVFEKIVAAARADGDGFAEVRGLHHLGSLHFEAGRLHEAADSYGQASRRAMEMAQPWGPYGLDARVMAALTAYITGDWDRAAVLTDVSGQAAPGLAEAALTAVRLEVLAGRGEPGGEAAVDRLRTWWAKDGMVGVLAGAAAVDLLGERDPEAGLRVHDDVVEAVTPLWETELFLARVRLSALVIGQLSHGVMTTTTPTPAPTPTALPGSRSGAAGARDRWAARADELLRAGLDAVARAERRGRPIGPEGTAWLTRLRAEHLRLRWLLGTGGVPVDPGELTDLWRRSAEEFARCGHAVETARSRERLAAVLHAAGRREEAAVSAAQARDAAEALGAAPLLAEIAALTPASRPAGTEAPQPSGPRSSTTRTAGDDLTPREREILVLVAEGHSNGEIGRRLFISTKTVSVHVSRILAKLGASGRTQAAAFARERGLLPH
jgi:DNA-binding CsgD family transcriptional regulator